ncbi:alpha/beta hydrolase [Hyphomonas sp.]|uniref:alpha/beta fold hydrolase n=1 Tax=Hyphomonas sp. TaxID=87 RepID=UPI0025C5A081|nr:alpha/beta hydrolase [Hyphomonas sp.]MBI1401166.1 alpha/beta fold hydrolase [Hyphomonas sp.]
MKWVVWVIGLLAFAMGTSWWAAGSSLKPLDDIERARAPGQFVQLPGAKVHYRFSGREGAPLIVMIHGYSTPGFIFEQNAAALRDAGFRVLQFDHLGRGWSDRPDSRYDTDFYDWELLALLDALSIKEPVGLVGLSMGGPIVAEFAVRHPERVARVFLFVPAGFDVAGLDGFRADLVRTPVIGDWIWRMVVMKNIMDDPQYDESGLAPENRLQGDFREQMKYRGYGGALLSTVRHFPLSGREDTYRALAATGIPVAAVFGDKDPTVLISSADKFAETMPKADLHVLEGADHGLNYKRHQDVNPILTGWFEQEARWFNDELEAVDEVAGDTAIDDEFGFDQPPLEVTPQQSQKIYPREPSVRPCRTSRINTSRCQ